MVDLGEVTGLGTFWKEREVGRNQKWGREDGSRSEARDSRDSGEEHRNGNYSCHF